MNSVVRVLEKLRANVKEKTQETSTCRACIAIWKAGRRQKDHVPIIIVFLEERKRATNMVT